MSDIDRPFSSIPGVYSLCTDIGDSTVPLHEMEAEHVRGAVPKRIREFAAGRALARLALSDLGVDAVPIVASPKRYPLWPDGVVGSISHSDTLVAVALARARVYRSVGIDIEEESAVPVSIVDTVITATERLAIAGGNDIENATVIFSCKEALFKAVYPLTHEFLEFHDVEIQLSGRTFSAACSAGKQSAELIQGGRGYIACCNRHVITLFVI